MQRKPLALFIILFGFFLISGCATTQSSTSSTVPAAAVQYKYVGSVDSDKYHKPSCQWAAKIKPENEIWFTSKEEAAKAGYQPCKTCKP